MPRNVTSGHGVQAIRIPGMLWPHPSSPTGRTRIISSRQIDRRIRTIDRFRPISRHGAVLGGAFLAACFLPVLAGPASPVLRLLSSRAARAQATASTGTASLHPERASSAAAFIDSVGVQTHMSYADTPYHNWPAVLAAIQTLGVHHIRDGLPAEPDLLQHHRDLGAAGIGCTCGFGVDRPLTPEAIVQNARRATDVEALEAANECDSGTNCGGGSQQGIAHVKASLPVLTEAGKRLNVPVIGPSFIRAEGYAAAGNLAPAINESNLHIYFGGRFPGTPGWGGGNAQGHRYGSIAWWLDQAKENTPGLPAVITETGYVAFPVPQHDGHIPESIEAAYVPRVLLLAWNQGIHHTFLYELLDEFPDTGYGLLHHDLTEKPAFTAVRNLLSLLIDAHGLASPGQLNFSLTPIGSGASVTPSHLLLQKGDGSFYLILWLEQSGYDAEHNVFTPVPPQQVQLALDRNTHLTDISTFDSKGNLQTKPGTGTSTFPVTDYLTVLHLTPNATTLPTTR